MGLSRVFLPEAMGKTLVVDLGCGLASQYWLPNINDPTPSVLPAMTWNARLVLVSKALRWQHSNRPLALSEDQNAAKTCKNFQKPPWQHRRRSSSLQRDSKDTFLSRLFNPATNFMDNVMFFLYRRTQCVRSAFYTRILFFTSLTSSYFIYCSNNNKIILILLLVFYYYS